MDGQIIVFEGTDGSGKATQCSRLCAKLAEYDTECKHVSFPRYESNFSYPVRGYLNGELGNSPSAVNAYAASTFYAIDRYASYKQDWEDYYNNGGLILCDRYTTSNAIHQASKLPVDEQKDFFNWLYDFEFNKLGLPKPDLVLYLDMPIKSSTSLLRSRENATNTKADIHEKDTEYLTKCRQTGRFAAEVLGWDVIPCWNDNGIRSIDDIHNDVWEKVEYFFLNY